MPAWDPDLLPDLNGRTYVVTGANAGLGYFASEQLVRAGAHVVMTGRNPLRVAAARAAVHRRVPGAADRGAVDTLLLDTSNLGSVRAAAATLRGRKRLDGLLLNAGIVHPPAHRQTTADGNELVYATNVLGHFALAGELLLPLAAGLGRMVWLGSMSTSLTPYDPVDPQLVDGYTPWRAYVQSKVATTALGLEAARRLGAAGVPVSSIVAHPGFSIGGRTAGVAGVNEPTSAKRFTDSLLTPIAQSKARGAWAPVRALTDPAARGGDVYGPRFVVKGEPKRVHPSRITRDRDVAERLWQDAEQTTQVKWRLDKAARPSLRRWWFSRR
ncbi:SDR family NAD(P)-dependent oxidoreductase [Microbacterium fluvii]|uniref:SDR family NAD(P)-dependent oxidoreductase n=1 Tax=Microbacterium fluvii TaxID=415215 RepID=A0ABW2HD14_9MICO|nr:SDR family NAD(P)-dependent oxidoreductase [Microbacterium fluvii]MCU4672869.1 SDR family NAD(P)-dependent oxidoreductase [Microbacterium fluvii]